ncbi:hypothetical protein DFJ73DRAFT_198127 [Zopfochytrium polystomum]|nr:hypothetical protein DFJ73DRAFT_198127 [Zopfochytrium polystomum]
MISDCWANKAMTLSVADDLERAERLQNLARQDQHGRRAERVHRRRHPPLPRHHPLHLQGLRGLARLQTRGQVWQRAPKAVPSPRVETSVAAFVTAHGRPDLVGNERRWRQPGRPAHPHAAPPLWYRHVPRPLPRRLLDRDGRTQPARHLLLRPPLRRHARAQRRLPTERGRRRGPAEPL